MDSFEHLGLSEEALKVLKRKGFEEPTLIQVKTIPAILQGNKDIVGQAQTGTGKTAAFGLPIIEFLHEKSRRVQALILTPTRELAIQVAEEINSLKGNKKLTIVPIYGGQSIDQQLRSLKKGIDVVVGTPGRIIDHTGRGSLKLDGLSYLVLDEADEMLNMGFIEEVKKILDQTPADKRTLLFSATMPEEIMDIAKEYMKDSEVFKVQKGQLTVSLTDQIYFEVSHTDKFEALCRIIDIEEDFYGLVFCRTKSDVDAVSNHLIERGYDADGLHGDLSQSQREKILNKFKKRLINILVATDVAARGIDVQNLSHVINYALPQDPESYVHRIGRTGRAGREGTAITFVTPEEYRRLQYIKKSTKSEIRKMRIPKVKEVIRAKKQRIKSDLALLVSSHLQERYLNMSRELLDEFAPAELVSALLQYSFEEELDEKSYAEIEDAVVDSKGTTRLFIAQGKKDGLTTRKLITLIKDKCSIERDKIRQIQILDKFSFVTLPFHEAEVVLSHFRKRKRGSGPMISEAKRKGKKR